MQSGHTGATERATDWWCCLWRISLQSCSPACSQSHHDLGQHPIVSVPSPQNKLSSRTFDHTTCLLFLPLFHEIKVLIVTNKTDCGWHRCCGRCKKWSLLESSTRFVQCPWFVPSLGSFSVGNECMLKSWSGRNLATWYVLSLPIPFNLNCGGFWNLSKGMETSKDDGFSK